MSTTKKPRRSRAKALEQAPAPTVKAESERVSAAQIRNAFEDAINEISVDLYRLTALVRVLQCGTNGHDGGPDTDEGLGCIADVTLDFVERLKKRVDDLNPINMR